MAFRHLLKLTWAARGVLPFDEIRFSGAWRLATKTSHSEFISESVKKDAEKNSA